jgi:hypothetical protein
MEVREFTPYLTVIGFVAGLIFLGDHVFKDSQKARLWDALLNVARLADRPLNGLFYVFVAALSLLATGGIVVLSGMAETNLIDAVKSIGPLLLPVGLKILVLDYVFALKSSWIIRQLLLGPPPRPDEPRFSWQVILASCVVVLVDFVGTAFITVVIFHHVEFFQAQQILPRLEASDSLPSLRSFFDTVSLMAKASIEYSLYALNGTTFIWVLLVIARLSDRMVTSLDADSIKRNIFKIIGTLLGGAVGLVIFIRVALT